MIVLDASAAIDSVLELGGRGEWASESIARTREIHAPHVIEVEFVSTLRRLARAGEIPARRGGQAIDDFSELPLTRYPTTLLLHRIWELRNALSAYDAAYVALAEALGLPLVTTDVRLARARGHRAEIVAYPD